MDRTRAWILMAAAAFFLVLPVDAHRPPIVSALRMAPVEILDLTTRTNNALVQTYNVGATNQLTSITRSGTLTVAGFTSTNATTLTVNGSSSGVAKYNDNSFAKEGLSLTDGNNTFTVVAQDGAGRSATNSVSVNLPATVSFTYDPQGNMTSDGHRDFEYDDADQLTAVEVSGEWRSEFEYDGFGRRRVRRERVWNGSSFETIDETRYLYDGMLVVQERDGNNVPRVTYTRGTDLSGGLSGAGGIGGLLARTDHTAATGHQHALYHADGGGNVTALINQKETVVAVYRYDPFGHTMTAAGPLADANPYRFSSKEFHEKSALYYYGFRFYDPNLQRWPNRDPIGETGGINVYRFAKNNPIYWVDQDGLDNWNRPRDGQNAPPYVVTEGMMPITPDFVGNTISFYNHFFVGRTNVIYGVAPNLGRPGPKQVTRLKEYMVGKPCLPVISGTMETSFNRTILKDRLTVGSTH